MCFVLRSIFNNSFSSLESYVIWAVCVGNHNREQVLARTTAKQTAATRKPNRSATQQGVDLLVDGVVWPRNLCKYVNEIVRLGTHSCTRIW